MKKRKFSPEYKAEAVKLVLEEGLKVPEAARNLGIGCSTLQKWVSLANSAGSSVSKQKLSLEAECKQLKKNLREAQMEVEILKKATAFFSKNVF